MSIVIRPAREADQAAITSLVHTARIHTHNLNWHRFMVAENQGRVVGVGQIRIYPDNCHELASLVVLPEYRQQGICTQLIQSLLVCAIGPLYMLVDEQYARHYAQFGFHPVKSVELPISLAKEYRVGRIITSLVSVLVRRKIRIISLRRDA
jgi:N-acetylglutamate synthase-like GNAT family acetyltransferase